MLTNERLEAIRKRCEAATSGPWDLRERIVSACPGFYPILIASTAKGVRGVPDAKFIAHSREDIPTLLAEIDRLRTRDCKFNLMLLSELRKVRPEGQGPDTLYFSDGLKTSVEIMLELEAAGLLERVGDGPNNNFFSKLTPEGLRMMEGGEVSPYLSQAVDFRTKLYEVEQKNFQA